MASLATADKTIVAKFLDVPVPLVDEELAAMSEPLRLYMEQLFDKYTD